MNSYRKEKVNTSPPTVWLKRDLCNNPCSFYPHLPFLLEKAMAPHSSTLAWKISWTEEPGRLQSMGSLRVRHDWATSLSLFTFMHWRRKWQPTPVFLPGESQDGGAWWAADCGVAQSRTRLKWLSSSSSPFLCSLKETSFQALVRCFSRTLAHHLLGIPTLWTKPLFHAPTPGSWFIGLSCGKENELGAGQFPLCCYSMGSVTANGQPAGFLWMHNPFS